MSPTIRIDDDVFDELKTHAEPFVDTPNTVLRRILGLGDVGADLNGGAGLDAEEIPRPPSSPAERTIRARGGGQRRRRTKASRSPRAKTGTILPESEYEAPMLAIIAEHGGRAAAGEVLDELETRLDGQLTEIDKQALTSGDVRWRNRAQFVRLRLVEQGDMIKDGPRGIWEITDQGRKRIAGAA